MLVFEVCGLRIIVLELKNDVVLCSDKTIYLVLEHFVVSNDYLELSMDFFALFIIRNSFQFELVMQIWCQVLLVLQLSVHLVDLVVNAV